MVSIKSLVLLGLVFLQGIQGYCIYNSFIDETTFSISHILSGTTEARINNQHIEKNGQSCCPYTKKDCSLNLVDNETAIFIVNFDDVPITDIPVRDVRCSTGGELYIGGALNSRYAICIHANGTYTKALQPVNIYIEI